ncbi:50S ribosomal protein L4 [Candidatus Daviesbacteria bacterium]|nr:50S ribosomal protein L4 [Candidatus Daviesbacteria bacterium]
MGNLSLPKEVFAQPVNSSLLSQAMRVYLNNKKGHFSNTKTRGEVEGSTRKIYRQKGTGRARHGAVRAPIFVGGGIALGPKVRKINLDLPKKMKKQALISALSQKLQEKEILGVANLDKALGKTKEFVNFLTKVSSAKKTALFLVGDRSEKALRAVKNIEKANLLDVNLLNAYEVIKHQTLILTKDAVEKLEKRLFKKKGKTSP